MSARYEISPPDESSPDDPQVAVPQGRSRPASHVPTLVASDGELLRQFASDASNAGSRTPDQAFAQIVDRHGAMVWRICRQILTRPMDAEDAFQVTFLLLARQSRTIRSSESAAGWLYRVAFRTAMAAKRRRHRDQTQPLESEPLAPEEAAFPDLATREIAGTLMEELEHLPAKYRTPLVLRYLEGHSRREIADQTDSTIATVQGQIARGKQMLRSRLLRRGISLSTAMALVVASKDARASSGQIAPRLISQTTSNAAAIVGGNSIAASTALVALYHSGVRAMYAPIVKPVMATAAVLIAFSLVLGSSLAPAEEQTDTAQPLTLQAEAGPALETAPATASLALQTERLKLAPEQRASPDQGNEAPAKPKITGNFVANPWQYDAQGRATDIDGNLLSEAELEAILKKHWSDALKNEPDLNGSEPTLHELSLRYQYGRLMMSQMNMRYQTLSPQLIKPGSRSAKEFDELHRQMNEVSAQRMLAKADLLEAERALRERLAEPTAKQTSQQSTPEKESKLEPYVIQTGDKIRVQATGTLPDQPLHDVFTVERGGTLALGPAYGRVKVAGRTLQEAERVLREALLLILDDPEVQITEAPPIATLEAAKPRPTPQNGSLEERWPSGGLKREADYVDGKVVAMAEYSEAGELLYEMVDEGPTDAATTQGEVPPPKPKRDPFLEQVEKLLTQYEEQAARLAGLDRVAREITATEWRRIARATTESDSLTNIADMNAGVLFDQSLKKATQQAWSKANSLEEPLQKAIGDWAASTAAGENLRDGSTTEATKKLTQKMREITQRWEKATEQIRKRNSATSGTLSPVRFDKQPHEVAVVYQPESYKQSNRSPFQAAKSMLIQAVETNPKNGSTKVDPSLSEIEVTFNLDMNTGGMSWTGGGEHFPTLDPTRKPRWIDKRTCVLPIKLQPGKFYRVGINSRSANNFKGVDGTPANHRVIAFATKGAKPSVKRMAQAPKVARMMPDQYQTVSNLDLREIRVEFDRPMSAGMSWNRSDKGEFPLRKGGGAVWSEDRKTCLLSVDLKPNTKYAVQLNGSHSINFQSEAGVPLEPTVWKFSTGDE